jgi:GT2 family glycosyltransferase
MKKIFSKIVIIVTNYNGETMKFKNKNILWYCFNSIKKTKYKNYKCIMVDDHSQDHSVKYVKTTFPWTKIIQNKQNKGYTITANIGIKYAIKLYKPKYIILLNNDVIINDANWLKKMIDAAELDEKVGLVTTKLLYPNGNLQCAGSIMKFGIIPRNIGWNTNTSSNYKGVKEVELIAGAAFLIKSNVINEIGFLDEIFRHGNDDIEYSIRARKAGFKLVCACDAEIIHLEGFTAKTISKNKKDKYFWFPIFQYQYMYLAFKHFNFIQKIGAIIVILLTSIVSIENKQFKIRNFKIKDKILWRFLISIKAINIAYKLHKNKITEKAAFNYFTKSERKQ